MKLVQEEKTASHDEKCGPCPGLAETADLKRSNRRSSLTCKGGGPHIRGVTARDKIKLLQVSIPDDDDALDLYSEKLIELCADVSAPRRLDHPDGSAHLRSRLCGSTVTIDVKLDEDSRVADLGFDVKACSLGSAATAILARHAVGASAEALTQVRDAVRSMLSGAETIDLPDGWDEIAVLAPARDVRARHSAIMIVFDAATDAVRNAAR